MYIYIITHPKFKGWIKIGRADNIEKRLSTYQTHCPKREFKLEFSILIDKYKANLIESYFDNNIEGNKHEWYKCSTKKATNIITKLLSADTKSNISSIRKYRYCIYNYFVNNEIFSTMQEVSDYTKIPYKDLTQLFKSKILELNINGIKITRQRIKKSL